MHPPVSAKNFNDFSASLKGRTNHDSKFSFMQAFEKRDWGKKIALRSKVVWQVLPSSPCLGPHIYRHTYAPSK